MKITKKELKRELVKINVKLSRNWNKASKTKYGSKRLMQNENVNFNVYPEGDNRQKY